MKKFVFLLLILTFSSCIEVIHEHNCCIVNKVYHEPYTEIKYVKTSECGILPVRTKHDEKYVLILYSIDLNKTIKHEIEKELYEKYNIGDTVLFYYETVELLTKKYQ
jgi:hypothetical protein